MTIISSSYGCVILYIFPGILGNKKKKKSFFLGRKEKKIQIMRYCKIHYLQVGSLLYTNFFFTFLMCRIIFHKPYIFVNKFNSSPTLCTNRLTMYWKSGRSALSHWLMVLADHTITGSRLTTGEHQASTS